MKRLHGWALLALLGGVGLAVAGGGPHSVREQMEASVLITGSMTIAPDGSVSGFSLDHPEKIEPDARKLIETNLPSWRFEPVLEHGQAVAATSKMSMLVVASRLDAHHFAARIRSANFYLASEDPQEDIKGLSMRPPRYPDAAVRDGVEGTVYLALQVDAAGVVRDVVAEQVNLRVYGSESQMKLLRDVFAKPSVKAANKWKFSADTRPDALSRQLRTVEVPVAFRLTPGMGHASNGYGRWETYIPGPRQAIPWPHEVSDRNASPDASMAGEVHELGRGLRLLTPVQSG